MRRTTQIKNMVPGRLGGRTRSEPVNAEIQELVDKVRSEVEEVTGKNFDMFEGKTVSSQAMNGIYYYIKVQTGRGKYLHITLRKLGGKATLEDILDGGSKFAGVA
ncbi:cystatin-A-like [Glandiceps talaboti]